jgi:hypothetical protein
MAWQDAGHARGCCGLIPIPPMTSPPTVVPAGDADELARVTRERDHLENMIAQFAMKAEKHFRETD